MPGRNCQKFYPLFCSAFFTSMTFVESFQPLGGHLKLISDATDGRKQVSLTPKEDAQPLTIIDPPNDVLVQGKEHAMVILVDSASRNVLLEVPNDLGWKYHFGCFFPAPTTSTNNFHEDICRQLATYCGSNSSDEEKLQLHLAGIMFFTFTAAHPPMRVRVFIAPWSLQSWSMVAPDTKGGKVYSFDDVPYDKMWADDRIWMPSLLENPKSYFEAHFIFDGLPGGESPLLKHSYQLHRPSLAG